MAVNNLSEKSIFKLLNHAFNVSIPIVRCSKTTLVYLSHALEDLMLTNPMPALIFSGFQKSNYWLKEAQRYDRLTEIAEHVCVFAAGDNSSEGGPSSPLYISLPENHPLQKEWFVAIYCDAFAVVMCGKDHETLAIDEAHWEFDAFWTFEPQLVRQVFEMLIEVVGQFHPTYLPTLLSALQKLSPKNPDARIVTEFTMRLFHFKEEFRQILYLATDIFLETTTELSQIKLFDNQNWLKTEMLLKRVSMVIFNQDKNLRYLWGYSPHVGFFPKSLSSSEILKSHSTLNHHHLARIKQEVLNNGAVIQEVVEVVIEDETYFFDLTIKPWRDSTGAIIGVSCEGVEITSYKRTEIALKEARTQMLYDSLHDSLTQLPNRRLLMQKLHEACTKSEMDDSYNFAVLFIDLDRFKLVNDSLGHRAGDSLLIMIAQRLQRSVGDHNFVARLGGDEFVVLLYKIKNPQDVLDRTKKISQTLSKAVIIEGHKFIVSSSIGVALSTHAHMNADALLHQADTAMYSAKAKPYTEVELFQYARQADALQQLVLERELRQAIENKEFELYYQPIVNLQTKKITYLETLIRWQHPERGILPPGEFLALAEKTGLIVQIDQWVLEEVCQRLIDWQQTVNFDLGIMLNMSIPSLQVLNIQTIIQNCLRMPFLTPNLLNIEISEKSTLNDLDSISSTLQKLLGFGMGFSLDDFGAGHSSLKYLEIIPLRSVKIDKSFIQNIGYQREAEIIIKTVINLAHELNLTVVAEGVETEAQLDFLDEQACDYVQGYLFSPAKPLAEIFSVH